MAFATFSVRTFSSWWLLAPVASFWWLGQRLQVAESERTRLSRAVTYYERALARLEHRWPDTGEKGERFLEEHQSHLYASDLDIFGSGSLFELLCQARTPMGQEMLAEWLLKPATPDLIRARQEAVTESASQLDLREDLVVLGETARAGVNTEALYAWGEQEPVLKPSSFRVFAWALSVFGATGVIAFLAYLLVVLGAFTLPDRTIAGLQLYFLSLTIAYSVVLRRFHKRTSQLIHDTDQVAPDLNLIAGVLSRLEAERFASRRLAMLRAELDIQSWPASRRIAKLNRLVQLIDSRRHMAMSIIAPLLLWDLHLSYAIEDWRRNSGSAMRRWLTAAAEMEAIASVGGYYYERPCDVFPNSFRKSLILRAKD